jgi:hypothetical protein
MGIEAGIVSVSLKAAILGQGHLAISFVEVNSP